VELTGEDLPCYSNEIYNQLVSENVHMIISLSDEGNLNDIRVTKNSKSFANKMAAKTS